MALNVRFPKPFVDRLDGYVETLKSRTPGASFTRSDALRIAAEIGLNEDAGEATPKKLAKGR